MKKILLGLLLISSSTFADNQPLVSSRFMSSDEPPLNTFIGHVNVNNIYRGEKVSDDPTIGLSFTLKDLIFEGIYTRGDFVTTELGDTIDYSADIGFGYKFDLTRLSGIEADISVNYIIDPLLREDDYAELRTFLNTNWNLFRFLDFYAHANYTLNDPNDFYIGAGFLMNDFILDDLDLRIGTNYYKFEEDEDFRSLDNWKRNNIEISSEYRFWRNVSVTGMYSIGRFGINRNQISDEWNVGLKFTF